MDSNNTTNNEAEYMDDQNNVEATAVAYCENNTFRNSRAKNILQSKNLRSFLGVVVFLILLTTALWKIDSIFSYDYSDSWYLDDRLEQLNSYEPGEIDALYVGGSRVSVGIAPILIWRETGLTGINIATNSQPPIISKYLTQKYVDKLQPKYVFIDLASILTSSSLTNSKTYRFETGLQFTETFSERWEIMRDHKEDFPDDDISEYIFPLYRDHTRWRSLKERDFVTETEYPIFLLGGINETSIKDENLTLENKEHYDSYETDIGFNEISMQYYQELVDYLLGQEIEVIVLKLPDVRGPGRAAASKSFADENNLTFIDMSIDPIFSDMDFELKGDFYDSGHLSLTGSYKYCTFLAHQLVNTYDIFNDERSDDDPLSVKFAQYYEDYLEYFEGRKGEFAKYYVGKEE